MKVLLLIILLMASTQSIKADEADTAKAKFNFKSLYNYAIQEDVKTILGVLDTLSPEMLTDADSQLKEKYYSRFRAFNESYDHNTSEQFIKDVIDIYREYWSSYLLKNKSIEESDTLLKTRLSEYLLSNYAKKNIWDKKEVTEDPMKFFSILLNKHGYFNNVDGKTGNLFDIYIWRTQDTINYDVKLADSEINVPVLFMKDIITLGWEEYATFGAAYPGGWPRDGMLFCVAKAYDVTDEKFLVSYLAHESQHFSDMEKYEQIPSWHLEYRAKLAELSKADATLDKLINAFIKSSKDDISLSHPYAQYLVIGDLSKKIFNEDFVTDMERWNKVDNGEINQISKELLLKDSAKLVLKK